MYIGVGQQLRNELTYIQMRINIYTNASSNMLSIDRMCERECVRERGREIDGECEAQSI